MPPFKHRAAPQAHLALADSLLAVHLRGLLLAALAAAHAEIGHAAVLARALERPVNKEVEGNRQSDQHDFSK